METAATLLAASSDGEMLTTNLNKALFYFDLFCMRDYGQVLTKALFLALPEGPTVASYDKKLIRALDRAGIAKQTPRGQSLPIKLLQMPNEFHFIDNKTRVLAEMVGAKISAMTARDISDFSHENVGWQMAYESGLLAKKPAAPIDLHIAMQQIIDDDPWIVQPLNSELFNIAQEADKFEGVAW